MSTITSLFQQAQLAEAAYANFLDDAGHLITTDKQLEAALTTGDGKFSQSQAADFVTHWEVVHHLPNTASGFSGTVFRRRDDDPISGLKAGDLVFALRGTEPGVQDLFQADLNEIVKNGLAFRQIIDMYNYWQRLTAPEGGLALQASLVLANPLTTPSNKLIYEGVIDSVGIPWTIELEYQPVGLGKVAHPDNLAAVTGHSLGGHLATAFTRLFAGWTTEAVTFNGAGYRMEASLGVVDNISNLFGMLRGLNDFPAADITNIYGDKNPEIVTMNSFFGLKQPGDHQPMFIEQKTVDAHIFGHGMAQVADSAAVFDLLVRIDGSLANATAERVISKFNPLFEAASPIRERGLENIVNALSDLYGTGVKIGDTQIDQREALYLAIN